MSELRSRYASHDWMNLLRLFLFPSKVFGLLSRISFGDVVEVISSVSSSSLLSQSVFASARAAGDKTGDSGSWLEVGMLVDLADGSFLISF